MRKHNRKFATRWGSCAVDPASAQLAHQTVHSKSFQIAANALLGKLYRKAGLA